MIERCNLPWGIDWQGAKRLLCVRLDSLGDVLMTTPAIRALKRCAADRHITLLTSPAGAEIASLVPEIDEVVVYEAPWLKIASRQQNSEPEYAMAERLRAGRFDGAVIFTVYSQNPLPSAFLCHLANIRLRLAHCHENPYQLLTHWVQDWEPMQGVRHEVQRQLDLVAAIGCRGAGEHLSLTVPNTARTSVETLFGELGLDLSRRWAIIHPGASAPSRRYAPEAYAEVTRRLVREQSYQIVFTGSADECDLVAAIRAAAGVPSISLAGRLSLAQLAALISLAPMLIANNTGPVHVAAAVGTPIVELYALTNPQHTPWAVPSRVLSHDVPCKFCYKSVCPLGHQNCLRLVAPADVVSAVEDLASATMQSEALRA